MKRIIIGTLVASLIFYAYQMIMWMGGIHSMPFSYTPNQDSIINNLNSNLSTDGVYHIPFVDPSLPDQENLHKEFMEKSVGKPWALVFYFQSMDAFGTVTMVKGFLYTLICCLLAVMVLYHGNFPSFQGRFGVGMAFSIFCLFQGVLGDMNWWGFPWSFVKAQVIDLTVGWALVSLWMAKYVKRP
jgi:hypothetical protein